MRTILQYHLLLVMCKYVHITEALFLDSCPANLMWSLRAKDLCGVKDNYICLHDTNERQFRELCKDKPEFHRPGNIFVISGNLQYFAARPCKENRYQPHKWWTNGSSECQYIKSTCNEEGQVPYDNGTITKDRKCRCDYTNYYTFVNRTRNKCYCDPDKEDCSCYRKTCDEDQVLTPDYDCVGIHRWTGRFVCLEHTSKKTTDNIKWPHRTTTCPEVKKDFSGTFQSRARKAYMATFGGILMLGLVIGIVKVITQNMRKDILQELKENVREKEAKSEPKQDISETRTEDVFTGRDSHQELIHDWTQDDNKFVSTRASIYVSECIRTHTCVTLTGSAGVGKSFVARHTALLLKKGGYKIIPVVSPKEICNYQSSDHIVFIVDDIFGNYVANQHHIENWKKLLPAITAIMANNNCKIIATCRFQVFENDDIDKSEILSSLRFCECNLISDRLCLTPKEKINIAKSYIDKCEIDIEKLPQNLDCFPLLCSLSVLRKDTEVIEFFKNPFQILKTELDNLNTLDDEGKCKVCSLAICVLFNNKLNEKWFRGKITDQQQQIIQDTCSSLGLDSYTTKAKLKMALRVLDGTFTHKENGSYSIINNTLFDFLVNYFGTHMIKCLLNHGDRHLVHDRFIWQQLPNYQKYYRHFMIEINELYIETYIKRLINDWLAGDVIVVFSNINMKESKFRQQFLQYLLKLDELKQASLCTTKETRLPKENPGSGTTPLIASCYFGYSEMVEWLLRTNVDVDQCRYDMVSGLYMASKGGYSNIVKMLMRKNPNVNLCDSYGCSPLFMASMNGHDDIVRLLLMKNPDIDICDYNGCTSLYMASKNGNTKIVQLLLEKNPDVDLCDDNGCSPLYMASANNFTGIVRLLIDSNAFVDLYANTGCSPLYMASNNGYVDIVQLLLTKNPTIDLCDTNGCSPLYMASKNGYVDIVQLLLKKNPTIDLCDYNGCSPLYMASKNKKTDVVRILLENNSNVDMCDNNGCSPLNIASVKGYTDIVVMLLDKKPNVNMCSNDGCSPLQMASMNGYKDIVSLLLEKSPNVDQRDIRGRSSLYMASENGHTVIVMLLLSRKNPDIDLCDNNRCSPLYIASKNGYTSIVKLLLRNDPDVNLYDRNGCTPLYMAIKNKHEYIVMLLLEKNAKVDLCDFDSLSPLYVASVEWTY